MRQPVTDSWQKEVLPNLLGITDRRRYESTRSAFLGVAAAFVLRSIDKGEFNRRRLDLEMMKDIHRTVNSAMFDWAGELRDEDKSKGGNLFCRPEFIEQEAERIFSSMRKELLGMMNEIQASSRIARYWGELNALHPFKHENAVTTNLMMQAFVRRHDMELDLSRTSPSLLREAVMSSFEGDVKPLAGIVRSGLRERGRGRG